MKALLLAGAALGGLLLLTNKSSAAAPISPVLPPAPSPEPRPIPAPMPSVLQPSGGIVPSVVNSVPPAVVVAINQALDSLDPDAINKEADALDAQGYKSQAADLRAVALGMRNAMQNAVT